MADTGNLDTTADTTADALEFIVDAKGRKTKVILTLEAYEALLEDLHDLAVVTARRDEPRMSFEAFERILKDDGVLPPDD